MRTSLVGAISDSTAYLTGLTEFSSEERYRYDGNKQSVDIEVDKFDVRAQYSMNLLSGKQHIYGTTSELEQVSETVVTSQVYQETSTSREMLEKLNELRDTLDNILDDGPYYDFWANFFNGSYLGAAQNDVNNNLNAFYSVINSSSDTQLDNFNNFSVDVSVTNSNELDPSGPDEKIRLWDYGSRESFFAKIDDIGAHIKTIYSEDIVTEVFSIRPTSTKNYLTSFGSQRISQVFQTISDNPYSSLLTQTNISSNTIASLFR